jgi:hypothetical protein
MRNLDGAFSFLARGAPGPSRHARCARFSPSLALCRRRYRHALDKTVTYALYRWLFFFILLSLFAMRVWYAQAWYIVSYSLGIYLLNLFIGFISPQVRDESAARPFLRAHP